MQHVALATPLFVGGNIKIGYDLLFYSAFRRLKPPEEEVIWTRDASIVYATNSMG